MHEGIPNTASICSQLMLLMQCTEFAGTRKLTARLFDARQTPAPALDSLIGCMLSHLPLGLDCGIDFANTLSGPSRGVLVLLQLGLGRNRANDRLGRVLGNDVGLVQLCGRVSHSGAARMPVARTILNSSVASLPAYSRMAFLPPGWSARKSVTFSTWPLMTTQQSVGLLCFATSSHE